MLLSEEVLADTRDATDEQLAKGLLLGIATMLKGGSPAQAIVEFVTEYINGIRLAEAGRVPVRDEGAN